MPKKKIAEFRVRGLENITPKMFRSLAAMAKLFPYPEIRFDDVAVSSIYVADSGNRGTRQINIQPGAKESVQLIIELFDYLDYFIVNNDGYVGKPTIIGYSPATAWLPPVQHISLHI